MCDILVDRQFTAKCLLEVKTKVCLHWDIREICILLMAPSNREIHRGELSSQGLTWGEAQHHEVVDENNSIVFSFKVAHFQQLQYAS